jgi:exodeoxyribonuclease V beta subunit
MTSEFIMRKEFKLQELEMKPKFAVIEAGAGAGKTYNLVGLVHRIACQSDKPFLANNRDIRRVLMVTFTTAAAQEMRQRLRAKFIEENAASAQRQLGGMFISTIHSFCHMAYRDYGPKAGLPPIEGEMQAGNALVTQIAQDWWRAEVANGRTPPAVSKCITCTKTVLATPNVKVGASFEPLKHYALKRSEELASETGIVTFDSAIKRLHSALTSDATSKRLRDEIHKDFDVCLVDEAQDTDNEQWEIIRTLFGPGTGKTLIMVGDRKQAIYGFRGADVENYLNAINLAKEKGEVFHINENNRCSFVMKDALNSIFAPESLSPFFGTKGTFQAIETPKDEPRKKKAEDLNLPHPVRIVKDDGDDIVVREVAKLLRELNPEADKEADEHKARKLIRHEATIGILTRTQKESESIHKALVSAGLPAAIAGNASIFSSPTAKHVHLLLSCVLNPERTGIRRSLIAMRPSIFALQGDLQAVLDEHEEPITQWLRATRELWLKKGFGAAWQNLTRTPPSNGMPNIRLASAIHANGARLLANIDHIGELLMLRERVLKLTPEALVDHLAGRIESEGATEEDEAAEEERIRPETAHPQIIVRTMHSAKGLEYHGVVLPGINDGLAIKNNRDKMNVLRSKGESEFVDEASDEAKKDAVADQNHMEKARLLYVALTRAQRKIVLLWGDEPISEKFSFAKCFQRVHGANNGSELATILGIQAESPAEEEEVAHAKRLAMQTKAILELETLHTPGYLRTSTSFSKLSDAEDDESKARGISGSSPDQLPLTDFPSGKAPGLMLHSLLETLDFARAAEDAEYCYAETLRKLTLSGLFQGKSAAQKEPMARKVADALPLWLKQPLAGSGLILAKTPKNGRSAEMRFSLRCALNNAVRKRDKLKGSWQDEIVLSFEKEYQATDKKALIITKEALSKEAVEGLLNGSIDMAITHQSDGRIYIIDWKSNKLGYLQEHYEGDKLINGVLGHCYQLQYTLYAAALHLHMRSCLKTWKYDDFGGCHYLFLRAFGHGNNNAGDFFHRPSWNQISSVLLALGFTPEEIN